MTDLALRAIGVAFALAWTLACGEISTTRASSSDEARRELEAGGWWPPEIPEAASAILETHDLDTNAQKITFSLERVACHEAAGRMGTRSLSTPAPVPALPLDGWPEWLSAVADAGDLSRRSATFIRTDSGSLVFACDEEKGYFWR